MLDWLGLVPAGLLDEHGLDRPVALLRWWTGLMLTGELSVRAAGDLIYWHGDHQEDPLFFELRASVVRYEDTVEARSVWDKDYAARCQAAEAEVKARARDWLDS